MLCWCCFFKAFLDELHKYVDLEESFFIEFVAIYLGCQQIYLWLGLSQA
jgi:hypothetical protein